MRFTSQSISSCSGAGFNPPTTPQSPKHVVPSSIKYYCYPASCLKLLHSAVSTTWGKQKPQRFTKKPGEPCTLCVVRTQDYTVFYSSLPRQLLAKGCILTLTLLLFPLFTLTVPMLLSLYVWCSQLGSFGTVSGGLS